MCPTWMLYAFSLAASILRLGQCYLLRSELMAFSLREWHSWIIVARQEEYRTRSMIERVIEKINIDMASVTGSVPISHYPRLY
jgi:hypothetical protein